MTLSRSTFTKLTWKVLAFGLLAVLVAVFGLAPSGEIQAQEGNDDSFVDLSVRFEPESPRTYKIVAENSGTAAASGVTVDVLLENQELGSAGAPAGTSLRDNDEGDVVGTWEIGTLRAGRTVEIEVETVNSETINVGEYATGRSRAEISSASWEHPVLRHDNVAEVWVMRAFGGKAGLITGHAATRTGVFLSVDDRYPDSGGAIEFTVVVNNGSGPSTMLDQTALDVEVSVELSDGLEFSPTWTPSPSQGDVHEEPR